MMDTKWKIGAGVAVLALGLWLVPAAVSGFTASTSFTTTEPLGSDGVSVGDAVEVPEATLDSLVDQDLLGSTSLSNYRLSMRGNVYAVEGVGDRVASSGGDYAMSYHDDQTGVTHTVSAGTFEMQTMGSLTGGDVMMNAALTEVAGAAEDFDGLSAADGLALSGASGDGRNFAAAINSGRGNWSNGSGAAGQRGSGEAGEGLDLDALGDLDNLNCEILRDLLLGCDHEKGLAGDLDHGGDSNATVVPEPTSMALLGLVGLGAMMRRGRGQRR